MFRRPPNPYRSTAAPPGEYFPGMPPDIDAILTRVFHVLLDEELRGRTDTPARVTAHEWWVLTNWFPLRLGRALMWGRPVEVVWAAPYSPPRALPPPDPADIA